ncbi:L,D-transpeptidase family protein [Geomonas sp. RF6]|uniref:L,D-transpeptidase family protein n=1 Tax=Geomonas sp. RF6 TaxID=2897342 RepID=UPI001E530E31|nr:L,D-transpeptidase family protein [Geomonas sp. RF6]UFS69582.1 L,D-transpeptidase family protein [Geomonas sp. RF6]
MPSLHRCRIPHPFLFPLIALVAFLAAGCATVPHGSATHIPDHEASTFVPRDLPASTAQLVVVADDGGARATVYALQRSPDGWHTRLGPLEASIGKKGFARIGEKREGDGKTPSGLFPLEFVFGYAASAPTRMPYRQATENDLWVDDPSSPDYNTWVRRGETSASSFELMKLPDHRYRHGVVIGYNRDPVVKGRGSAIFIHEWLEMGRPTAGCVALNEAGIVSLISWLDPGEHPMILMGDAAVAAAPGREEGMR